MTFRLRVYELTVSSEGGGVAVTCQEMGHVGDDATHFAAIFVAIKAGNVPAGNWIL